jgi:hypothetical protein
MEAMEGNVSEMVTTALNPVSNGYVATGGRQLLDRKVVHIREKPISEEEGCQDH